MCKMFFMLPVRHGHRSLWLEDVFPRTVFLSGVGKSLEWLQLKVACRWSTVTSILSQLSRMRRIRDTSGSFVIEIVPVFLKCRKKMSDERRNRSQGIIFIFGAKVTNTERSEI